jgi:predicted RNase H-like nuclease (RuvC/YqgF family)
MIDIGCAACGIRFSIPNAVDERRREDHKTFYCPNGHGNYYPGPSAKEKRIAALERQVRQLENRLELHGERIAELEHVVRSLRSRLAWARRRTDEIGRAA